jgi:hypothetical protein
VIHLRCMLVSLLLWGAIPVPGAQAQPVPGIQSWLAQLAHADPEVRAQARFELLGLDPAELPRLRQAVADARPLAPSQSAVLREIVEHVFLSGEAYEVAPGDAPFLGITMTEGIFNLDDANPREPWQRLGVTVGERMPGFAAYRVLLDGDIIVGMDELPELQIRSPSDLVEALRTRQAGDTVHLRVLRGGRVLRLAVVLGQRPMWAERFGRDEVQVRQQAADTYWLQHFAALVAAPVS